MILAQIVALRDGREEDWGLLGFDPLPQEGQWLRVGDRMQSPHHV